MERSMVMVMESLGTAAKPVFAVFMGVVATRPWDVSDLIPWIFHHLKNNLQGLACGVTK